MDHTFSVEMKSKKHVRHISLSNESHEHVLFEGSLGELEELSMVEEVVLEVKGTNGVLRVDLNRAELRELFKDRDDEQRDPRRVRLENARIHAKGVDEE